MHQGQPADFGAILADEHDVCELGRVEHALQMRHDLRRHTTAQRCVSMRAVVCQAHTHTHTHTHTHMYIYIYTYMCVCIYIIYIYKYTYIYMHLDLKSHAAPLNASLPCMLPFARACIVVWGLSVSPYYTTTTHARHIYSSMRTHSAAMYVSSEGVTRP